MKNTALAIALTIGVSVALLGCSQSDEAKAQDYAVKACGMASDDSGTPKRDDSGRVVYNVSARIINPDTAPMNEVTSWRDDVRGNATNAQAGAQLDSAWRALAKAFTENAGMLDEWIAIRESGQSALNRAEYANEANGFIANSSEIGAICSGLAARLSG